MDIKRLGVWIFSRDGSQNPTFNVPVPSLVVRISSFRGGYALDSIKDYLFHSEQTAGEMPAFSKDFFMVFFAELGTASGNLSEFYGDNYHLTYLSAIHTL